MNKVNTITIEIEEGKWFGDWEGTDNISIEQLEALADQLNTIICERYHMEME